MGVPNTPSSSTTTPAPPKRSRAQPTADGQTQFLYLILKQLDLKAVNWQEVADGIGIKNGHAARMRWSRFKAQTEGLPTQSQKKSQKKKDCEGKAMACGDPNQNGSGGYYGSSMKHGYDNSLEAAMADEGAPTTKRVKLEYGGFGPAPPPFMMPPFMGTPPPGHAAPANYASPQLFAQQTAAGMWGPSPPPPSAMIKAEPGVNIKHEYGFGMLQHQAPTQPVACPWLGPPATSTPATVGPAQMPQAHIPVAASPKATNTHVAITDPDDLPIRQTLVKIEPVPNGVDPTPSAHATTSTSISNQASILIPVQDPATATESTAAAVTAQTSPTSGSPESSEAVVSSAKTARVSVALSSIPQYDGTDENDNESTKDVPLDTEQRKNNEASPTESARTGPVEFTSEGSPIPVPPQPSGLGVTPRASIEPVQQPTPSNQAPNSATSAQPIAYAPQPFLAQQRDAFIAAQLAPAPYPATQPTWSANPYYNPYFNTFLNSEAASRASVVPMSPWLNSEYGSWDPGWHPLVAEDVVFPAVPYQRVPQQLGQFYSAQNGMGAAPSYNLQGMAAQALGGAMNGNGFVEQESFVAQLEGVGTGTGDGGSDGAGVGAEAAGKEREMEK
ncbi:uncharacterized protein AB675_11517 [Cyphellophora attinorum]|uniref:Myb-like DNA-binding domain-containing protein n=1 Tax=Cyphellophora attinorum TaxID=1664694 RepID=A0A0N0NM51_9EURO|nr:uncharacterized protein AB675_11517 [Phialophora attinorum]KPI40051.1 hypothetical protein AB675_11517 [Phialophora attinorum]